MKRRQWRLVGIATAVLLVAGCGGGGSGSGSEEPQQFTTNPTGELRAWGFDNADDVGKARLDYAASKLSQVKVTLDATGFDAQKFTTRLASGDVPDVVQMDRQFVATYAAQDLITAARRVLQGLGCGPAEAVLSGGDRRRDLGRTRLGRAAVLPARRRSC